MFLNFLITDQENALTTKHLKSYLMSIYVNVALDLTNYHKKTTLIYTSVVNLYLIIISSLFGPVEMYLNFLPSFSSMNSM